MVQFLLERRNATLLIALFVVCFTLMTSSARLRGRSTLMDRILFSITGQVVRVAAVPGKWSIDAWRAYRELRDAREENAALKKRAQSLSMQHVQMQEMKSKIARLEKLLQAARNMPAPIRLARILAHDRNIYGKSLIVDLGAAHGVRKNMPVVHHAGLVGRIFRVGASVSQVLLLLDSRSAVNVIAQRSRAQGVFAISSAGEGEVRSSNGAPEARYPEVRYMETNGEVEIQVGEVLVSSGLGGIFPKGFPVAHITGISDRRGLFPKVKAKPVVDFSSLEEVMILMTKPKETPRE